VNQGIRGIKYKLEDHMFIGSVYDNIMKKTKYREEPLQFLYNTMVGQKHRMLYYKKLKKKYFDKAIAEPIWEKLPKAKNSSTIWFCWLQGLDQAPELVKRCYESLLNNFPDKEIVVIDEGNLFEYANLPDYIIDKWRKGIIGAAHFSDLVRLSILTERGGCWIDATVLCTDGKLIRMMEEEPLFMFSFYYFGFNPEIMELNNWFIYSCTNNNILCLIQKLLYLYWKENNRAVDYFIFHIFTTMAVRYYNEEYKRMPIISQVDSHILATYIFDDYNQEKYDILKAQCGIHKLSTRFDESLKKKSDTFYDVVIRQGRI
jgi:hypothetical protein